MKTIREELGEQDVVDEDGRNENGDDVQQFDLRIVGGEECLAFVGHEGAAYFLAVGIADGDVLQVRVRRRESAGCRYGLVERRMNAPCCRQDKFG